MLAGDGYGIDDDLGRHQLPDPNGLMIAGTELFGLLTI